MELVVSNTKKLAELSSRLELLTSLGGSRVGMLDLDGVCLL